MPSLVAPERSGGPALDHEPEFSVRGRSINGLEGLRGVAIGLVVLYHLHLGYFTGGYLGVDLFFVLSGFLITSLLIEEHRAKGRLSLRGFWLRRAKRLLPALFALLGGLTVLVMVHAWLSGASSVDALNPRYFRGDAIATIFFYFNWHAIWLVESGTAGLSPRLLWPTWSLAVEEQFYLAWPLLTLAVLRFGGRRARRWGAGISIVLAIAGATYMAVLWGQTHNTSVVVYNTFARGFSLAVGAGLAWVTANRPQPGAQMRRVLAVAAPIALVVALWLTWHTGQVWFFYAPYPYMYYGGFLAFSLLIAIVIADVRQHRPSPLGRLLSVRPLRYLGTISYGLYLVNGIFFAILIPERTHLSTGWNNLLNVVLAISVASLSYHLLERPIRRSSVIDRHLWSIPLAFAVITALVVVTTSPALVGKGTLRPPTTPPMPYANGRYPGQGGVVGSLPDPMPTRWKLAGETMASQIAGPLVQALRGHGQAATFQAQGGNQALPARLRGLTGTKEGTVVVVTCEIGDLRRGADLSDLGAAASAVASPESGRALVILGCPRPVSGTKAVASYAAGQAAFNRAAASAARNGNGRVAFLPVQRSLLNRHGKPSTASMPRSANPTAPYPQGWVRTRMTGGLYLCQPGAVRVTAAALRDLETLGAPVSVAGRWWTGRWRASSAFDAPGSCPR